MLRKLFILSLLVAAMVLPALAQDSGLTAKEIEEIGRSGAVSVGGGVGPQSGLLLQDVMTPNETLVMNWIEASVSSSKVENAAQKLLAPNFVFYGMFDSPASDAATFINLNVGAYYLPNSLSNCVVKSEDDLVEASYNLMNIYGMQNVPQTVLFRVEDGKIAEVWVGHTLP